MIIIIVLAVKKNSIIKDNENSEETFDNVFGDIATKEEEQTQINDAIEEDENEISNSDESAETADLEEKYEKAGQKDFDGAFGCPGGGGQGEIPGGGLPLLQHGIHLHRGRAFEIKAPLFFVENFHFCG